MTISQQDVQRLMDAELNDPVLVSGYLDSDEYHPAGH
jgi:hypothetical protein